MQRRHSSVLLFALVVLSAAHPCGAQLVEIRPDKTNGIYRVGDTVHWTVTWRGSSSAPATSSNYISLANGELTLSGMDATSFYTLASAAPSTNAAGYVGRAWGGGAFIQSRFHFDPALMNTNGWPAFWSMAIEHMARPGVADQWPGQAVGYAHFIEDDFFEYDTYAFAGAQSYGAALHDWYGIWNPTTGYSNIFNQTRFVVHTPAGTDFNQFHSYAQLWVPSTNGQAGFVINYFDGSPLSQVSWVGAGTGTPPPSGSSLFSIIDQNHLALCLGTGVGEPMVFDWVRVWQLRSQASSYAPNRTVSGEHTENPAKSSPDQNEAPAGSHSPARGTGHDRPDRYEGATWDVVEILMRSPHDLGAN